MRTRPCREKGRKNKENRRKGKEEDGSAKEKGGKELGWCSIAALTVAFRQRFFFLEEKVSRGPRWPPTKSAKWEAGEPPFSRKLGRRV